MSISKKIYLQKDSKDELNNKYKNVSIILLKEDLFIKIICFNNKDKIDNILFENINKSFNNYEVLVHYEILKFHKKKYIIIYFLKYSSKLKNEIIKLNNISIKPYQFMCKLGKYRQGTSIIVITFKESNYLIIKIKGKIIYTRDITKDSDYIESIDKGLKVIKEVLKIDKEKTILYISKELYKDEFRSKFYKINIINRRVS